jgi:SecD/SecF fusion protein
MGGSGTTLPVLTLPGIAGIVLTVGMAVDANVLIFERIREEMRLGKRFGAALTAGYEKAFATIFDSNLTTLLTALILFVWGSGPIRGYAVTLSAGLIVSLYTAVVCVRMFLNAIASRRTDTAVLKMGTLFSNTAFDFVSKWKPAVAFSVIVIVGTWAWMVASGIRNPSNVLGVDFTGGTSLTMAFQNKVEVENVRRTLAAAGVFDAQIQYQREADQSGGEYLQIKTSASHGDTIASSLAGAFPDAGFRVLQEDDVGPQIGGEMRMQALKALLFALIGMILYISWRFELGFAVGAVVALLHDALITVGICVALGLQANLTMVAAILTIVGYSVNDTIVIFDRIREDVRLVRNKSFLEICNLSLNQTLSRTVLTTFLTLLSVGALLLFGGGAIKDFALIMFIGLVAGIYSTVFIATPVVLLWYRFKTPDLGRTMAK